MNLKINRQTELMTKMIEVYKEYSQINNDDNDENVRSITFGKQAINLSWDSLVGKEVRSQNW